jgi:hypothetical protein
MDSKLASKTSAQRATRRRIALSFPPARFVAVLFHQLDVIGDQAGCDVDIAIREAIKGLTGFATFAD